MRFHRRTDISSSAASVRPRPQPAQLACVQHPELQRPAPDGFVGDLDTAFGEQILDIAVAQREAEIQPDGVLDDLGGNR